jgi:hypothetical protein
LNAQRYVERKKAAFAAFFILYPFSFSKSFAFALLYHLSFIV